MGNIRGYRIRVYPWQRLGILNRRMVFKRLLQSKQARANRGSKEPEVTHFHKASGEHMLEETVNEFLCRERTAFELSGVGSAVLKGDLGRFHSAGVQHLDQTAIAESHPVDIGSQILERSLPVANRLAVHDPIAVPDLWRYLCEEGCCAQEMLEASAEQSRECPHWQEEIVARREPSLSISAQPAAWNEIMDMRMVGQIACPAMQHSHPAYLASNETRVAGQLLGGLRRGTEQRVIEEFLVSAGEEAQLCWKGEGQQKVGHWQEQFLLQVEPFLRLFLLAFWAVTIAAGIITESDLATSGASVNLASQGLCAALLNSPHSLAMTRQQALRIFLAISCTVVTKDLRQF